MTPFPTQTNVDAAMLSFLASVLPTGTEVVVGQQNRLPEPQGVDWVQMTITRMRRLRTNVSSSADVRFEGSIAGIGLTVTNVDLGTIVPGAQLFGVGVAGNTHIVSQTGGTPGGAGTYTVDVSQTVGAEVLSSGARAVEQGTEVAVQLDFHAAGGSGDSGDMAATVSTLFRDEYATTQFANQSPNYGVVPLHADDPRQVPFLNEAQAIETVWTVDALLQANLVVSIPQQYADAAAVTVISVDATYPPS